jgi:hypothetical protein
VLKEWEVTCLTKSAFWLLLFEALWFSLGLQELVKVSNHDRCHRRSMTGVILTMFRPWSGVGGFVLNLRGLTKSFLVVGLWCGKYCD